MLTVKEVKAQNKAAYFKTEMRGKRYKDYKGDIYIVADVAVDAENLRITVIYKDFVTLGPTWSSYLEDFLRFNEPLENHKEETENEQS
mgnify:FL=1|jgi:hypothetical protein